MTDVFLLFDMQVFEILSGFFDYYLDNYKLTHQGHDIHSLLAKYVIENRLITKGDLEQYCTFTILRNNSKQMFDNGLRIQYCFKDLEERDAQWRVNDTIKK